jgi:hypothetical protein
MNDQKPPTATQTSDLPLGSTPGDPDPTRLCWTLLLREQDRRAAAGDGFRPLPAAQNTAPVITQAPSVASGPSTDVVGAMRLGAQLLRELGMEGTELDPDTLPPGDEARTRAVMQHRADDGEPPRGNRG